MSYRRALRCRAVPCSAVRCRTLRSLAALAASVLASAVVRLGPSKVRVLGSWIQHCLQLFFLSLSLCVLSVPVPHLVVAVVLEDSVSGTRQLHNHHSHIPLSTSSHLPPPPPQYHHYPPFNCALKVVFDLMGALCWGKCT